MVEEANQTKPETKKTESKKSSKNKGSKATKVFAVMMVVFIVATAALGGLSYIVNSNAKKQQSAQQKEIDKLAEEKKDLLEQLKKAKADLKSAKSAVAPSTSCSEPTSADLENIKASITSGNTAALEGYMADTVTVIYAASEGLGPQTPTQAIADLKYLKSATNPWDFALPAATISAWASGGYSSYISTDSLVGKSANNYVVAFSFDCSGDIDTILMAANSALL